MGEVTAGEKKPGYKPLAPEFGKARNTTSNSIKERLMRLLRIGTAGAALTAGAGIAANSVYDNEDPITVTKNIVHNAPVVGGAIKDKFTTDSESQNAVLNQPVVNPEGQK